MASRDVYDDFYAVMDEYHGLRSVGSILTNSGSLLYDVEKLGRTSAPSYFMVLPRRVFDEQVLPSIDGLVTCAQAFHRQFPREVSEFAQCDVRVIEDVMQCASNVMGSLDSLMFEVQNLRENVDGERQLRGVQLKDFHGVTNSLVAKSKALVRVACEYGQVFEGLHGVYHRVVSEEVV